MTKATKLNRTLLLLVLAASALAVVSHSRAAFAQPIVIEGATVWVSPERKLENASVLIRDGKIAQVVVGKLAVPPNAVRINGSGKVVTAGFIEASSNLGISEVSLVSDTNDGSFNTAKNGGVFASYRVADGYNENSVSIPIARSHGITATVSSPRGGFVAGIGAAFSMAAPAGDSNQIRRDTVMVANLGIGALRANDGSRGLAIANLRQLFDDARQFSRSRAAFDRNQSRKLAASRRDLEALGTVLSGNVPLLIRANRVSDIRAALRLAKELKIRVIIEGGTEAWMLAKELAAAKVPVIVEPSRNLPGSFDQVHVREDNAAKLAAAGVPVIVSTLGSAAFVRTLRQLAGIAVARGLPWKDALAAVTTVPATSFALGNRGSLARGAIADVVVWSGDPFELSSRAEAVIIGGKQQSLRTRQTELFERYRRLPATRR